MRSSGSILAGKIRPGETGRRPRFRRRSSGSARCGSSSIEFPGAFRDERMRDDLAGGLLWPALLHFPERASLLIEAPAAGRASGIQVLQSVMMRFLTSMPAGRVRMTIVDPVGLGSDFGTFLHLEDQGLPVPVRTDAHQIEQSLGDICGHVEKIIQSYLRDDHPTINDFNALAGEVAEPFRILVICDFPAGFNQISCTRLSQVIDHRARCGVLTLVLADPGEPSPPGVTLGKLAAQAVHLVWRDGRFVWHDPDFAPFSLELDPPPPHLPAQQILRLVGAGRPGGPAASRFRLSLSHRPPSHGGRRIAGRASRSVWARGDRPRSSRSRSARAPRSTC